MPISLTCSSCDRSFRTADANAGKRGKCPGCGAAVLIPAAESASEASPEPAPVTSTPRRRSKRPGRLPNLGDAAEESPESKLSPAALGLGALAALLGAAVWAGVMIKTGYEIGWVAWGIGGAVGAAVAKAGGRGVPMAATAAVLALLSVAGGKWVGAAVVLEDEFGADYDREVERMVEDNRNYATYKEIESDARLWVELEGPASDAQLSRFMVDRNYTEAASTGGVTSGELEWFRADQGPFLVEFHAAPPTYDEWAVDWEAGFREQMNDYKTEYTPLMYTLEGLTIMDLIFAALGLATAWGFVMRARG